MQTISVTLTVYHDGQFFLAVFEMRDDTGCRAARRVFAMPPSGPEIYELVLKAYGALSFSASLPDTAELKAIAQNPKRRQREAVRAQQQAVPSTYAQAALQVQREASGIIARHERTQEKREREREQFALRTQKKKKKHRGH